MSVIATQKIVWNGEILVVPFGAGKTTAGHVLALVPGEPEMGLFATDGTQLDDGSALPGGDEELILRPVYLH